MRIEEYMRELTGNGYTVIGSVAHGEHNIHDYSRHNPITMSLSNGTLYHPASDEQPFYDNLEYLINISKPEIPYDNEATDNFEENYAEIMRGNRKDWQLGGFNVFVGGIHLGFGRPETGDNCSIYIVGAKDLWLTFRTSRTRLGFVPTYNVRIKHNDDGGHIFTKIEEDLGYVYRDIEFKLKNPNKEKDDICHSNNQYLKVTEYTDI